MDFQIIALDIDGTLTDDRKKISSLTLETLIEAEKKGIRLVLASARPAPGLFSIRDQLKMEQFGGILMSYNGGKITDCEGNTFYEISMDFATTRRILRFLEELPVTVIVDDGKMFYVTDKNGYKVEYECRNNQMQCIEVDNLADWLTFSPIKLLLAVDPMKIYEVQEQIRNFLPEDLTVVRTAAFYLEIFSRRINKGQGLCDICKILKIDVKNSIAFGDSENDIPMLKAAGIGIAMKNAEMDVKKASDMCTLSNKEDFNFEWLPGFREMMVCQNDSQAQSLLPPEQLQQEEQKYWKDYEYLIQMLPMVVREVWIVVDALLDRYEYAGSSIYSEYPDKVTILKIADMVYDKLKYREEQEMIQTNDEAMIRNPYFIEVSLRDGNSPFRTLIQVVLHWNINHRRQRYYRRQKVFSNR